MAQDPEIERRYVDADAALSAAVDGVGTPEEKRAAQDEYRKAGLAYIADLEANGFSAPAGLRESIDQATTGI